MVARNRTSSASLIQAGFVPDWFDSGAGQRVRFWTRGEGPVVLFVHGWLHASVVWRHVAARWSGSYKLVLVYLPGFG